ncbi:MAG: hypothetical protein HZR80_10740 [Candidatus Heimdallarchaeota archaeon]
MSETNNRRGSSGCRIFEVIMGIVIIALVLLLILFEDFNSQSIIALSVVLGILVLSLILTLIFYRLRRSRPELFRRYPRRRQLRSPYESVRSDSYQYTTNEHIITEKPEKKAIHGISVDKNSICSICKLSIVENKEILVCPECKSPFYKEHLID